MRSVDMNNFRLLVEMVLKVLETPLDIPFGVIIACTIINIIYPICDDAYSRISSIYHHATAKILSDVDRGSTYGNLEEKNSILHGDMSREDAAAGNRFDATARRLGPPTLRLPILSRVSLSIVSHFPPLLLLLLLHATTQQHIYID